MSEKVILFQGDSITDADRSYTCDAYHGRGYANMVQGQLGMECPGTYKFYNRGISGNRVTDLYARIKRDITNLKPDYMSILIGINDVGHELWGRQDGVDADKYEKIYDMLIAEVKEALPNIKIMILEPFVLEGTGTESTLEEPERWEAFCAEVPKRIAAAKRIAEKHGLVYVPLQEKFNELCQKAPASYWIEDGVHPTAMGHCVIKEEWMKAFQKLLSC